MDFIILFEMYNKIVPPNTPPNSSRPYKSILSQYKEKTRPEPNLDGWIIIEEENNFIPLK